MTTINGSTFNKICFSELYFLKSIISTQNDVVEVRAESAEEYAAAIIPIINKMPTYQVIQSLKQY